MTDQGELLLALREYRTAPQRFLEVLGCESSNRDPLDEFAWR
jgi:hypothetical protein